MKYYRDSQTALKKLGLAPRPELAEVEKRYPVLITGHYLGLIDPALGENDPIYRQCLPDPAELLDEESSFDPLAEEEQMPVPRVIHRFVDRVVLLATFHCEMRCRFCFRKRTWLGGQKLAPAISDAELEAAAAYLRRHPEIREVLISGGDPLTLPLSRIQKILETLRSVPHLDILRVATRLPVVDPARISDAVIELLAATPGLWIATHFNHPRELAPAACELLTKFVRHGIPVINQTVLLKGVNDNPDTLEELFRALVKLRVKPHYLFHVDPVRGVRHFATGIECGLDILRAFRPRLSSLAVPTFAIDLPEGGGKVALQPDYSTGEDRSAFADIHNRKEIPYPTPPIS